jgi:Tol biopolymer transport system component
MRRKATSRFRFVIATLPLAYAACTGAGSPARTPRESKQITVREGTSMAVAASPDGNTLAVDLQGTIWTLPAVGGAATALTDGFDDARQPSWSPDGRVIAFQGYRDGSYDIWAVDATGANQRKITSGAYDDREPVWSHDGTWIAFSSDRDVNGNYDIWTVEVRTGAVRQVTTNAANDYMPTWSRDDRELAFISARDGGQAVWAITLASGAERMVSPTGTRADAPSWGPGGRILYTVTAGQSSRMELDGTSLTGDENVAPFRAAWVSPSDFYYTADGGIRRRSLTGTSARAIAFSATLTVTPAHYTRRVRDVDSRASRRALGIVRPEISPDGQSVAFAALGDLWLMRIGQKPENLTKDRFLDTEPAWSPDGTRLVYASDKGGGLLNLWIRDLRTGEERQLTRLETSAMGAAWSPDGRRIAFLDVDGIWRRASISVVDVASGEVTRVHASMFGPGAPTWSADGKRVIVAALVPYSSRFREGTNQTLSMAADGTGDDRWYTPAPHFSIDSRVGAGPVASPDGSKMLVINDGVLTIIPVSATGAATGAPKRMTTEMAHAPSWTADSRSVMYQSMDKLRVLDIERGTVKDVPLDLSYTPAIPTARYLVHAGSLVDGISATARTDMDIVIEGNRIRAVEPHRAEAHTGTTVVDASGLTVMPGLIEYHTHLQKDLGAAHDRAWLAFGITTVRSPGGTPYEAVEDREAVDAGVRVGPRVFATGYLLEWERTYYKMAVAIATPRHLELELQRARVLQHDLIKSYVRMPDLRQRRIIEFAHSIGVPTSSHEIYPSTLVGVDGVEHTTGTSRRGYSPKAGSLGRSYADVAAIIGGAELTFTPTLTLSATWLRRMTDADSSLKTDPRFGLLPPWMSAAVTGAAPAGGGGRGGGRGGRGGGGGGGAAGGGRGGAAEAEVGAGAGGQMIMAIGRTGAHIVAGTDTPNPANLHAELMAYVLAGMTPFEALRAATVTPAAALGLDAGSIAPGKLADLLVVEGNPLDNIAAARRVRRVIANGRVLDLAELLNGGRR